MIELAHETHAALACKEPREATSGARPSRMMDAATLLSGAGSAILDQSLVSGANFLFTLLLARWMTAPDYGIFAVVNSILVFFTGAHSALLLEPMSVLGPARFSDDLRRYLKAMTRINAAIAFPAAGLLLIAGTSCILLQEHRPLGFTLVALAFSLTCMFFFQTYRRLCYVDHRPQRALVGSLSYAAMVISGIVVLRVRFSVSPAMVILLIGASGMIAGLIDLRRFLAVHDRTPAATPLDGARVWRDHWNYGRWILLATLTYWGSTEIYYTLTAWRVSLGEAAALRALQNLIAPAMQTIGAIAMLLLPWVSTVFAKSGPKAAMAFVRKINQILILGTVVYGVILWLAGASIMRFLYAGRYASHAHLLIFTACLPILAALSTGPQLILRAGQRPWAIMIGYGVSAGLTATLGLAAVWQWGIEGAAFGLTLSLGTYALAVHRLAARPQRC